MKAARCLQDPRVDVQSRTASELSWKSWTHNQMAIPVDPIKLKGPLQRNHREPKARRLQSLRVNQNLTREKATPVI